MVEAGENYTATKHVIKFKYRRTNQGKHCKGRTPMDTFLDGLKLCDKYLYGYNNTETEKTEKGVLQKCDMGDDFEKGKGLGTLLYVLMGFG